MDKPQYILEQANKVLVPSNNYILQRRFSAKEDKRRLVCAPLEKSRFTAAYLGFENKINFLYKLGGDFKRSELYGVAVLLNSEFYDTYFRIINGNINVSATEVRILPMPHLEVICAIGNVYLSEGVVKESRLQELLFSQETVVGV